ncbi:MAG TPA: hypothetical protein VET27_17805 [Mycobacterium sp.]|nr:hypothetical protein [Mycobacterium sp.]
MAETRRILRFTRAGMGIRHAVAVFENPGDLAARLDESPIGRLVASASDGG